MMKAKGKRQKAKIKSEEDEQRGFRLPLLPFDFCLLPFAFSVSLCLCGKSSNDF